MGLRPRGATDADGDTLSDTWEGELGPDAADTDDDGRHSVADAIFLLSFLFLGADQKPNPRAPFPDCGVDPTEDGLNRVATNNTEPDPNPANRDPALGCCVYPQDRCVD